MPETIHTEPPQRLPSVDAMPVPEAQADELMRHWRSLGVWLSAWDLRGRMLWYDRQGPRVWTTLLARSALVRDHMRRVARAASDGEIPPGGTGVPCGTGVSPVGLTGETPVPHETPASAPWGAALRLTVVPVMRRARIAGVVLAGSVRGAPDEDFVRLCDRSKLDAAALARMMERTARHDDAFAESWRGLLEMTLRQAHEADATARQIESFTRNLDDTYEELSLIYGVTGMLSMGESPDHAICHVAEESLAVSRTAGLLFLLPTRPSVELTLTAGSVRNELRTLRVGAVGAEPDRWRRLAEGLDVVPADRGANPLARPMPGYVLRNRIALDGHWSWTEGWLEHVVALPLVHKDRWLGVMIAVNRTDESDFSSVGVKFLRAVADRVTSFLETRRLYDDLADLLMGLLHAMVSSIDAKDPYTCGHSERVAALSRLLAQQAGFQPAECQRVYLAGLLHDVGKIGVPDAILCKPGKLTEEEFRVLRRHPQIGARILSRIQQVRDLLPGVLHHHERMDGRGYPEGRCGEDIPLLGRLICLADCFDAMTTNRTYRSALPMEAALAEVRRCAGTQFDPRLAEMFLRIDIPQFLAESAAAAEAATVAAATPTPTMLTADPQQVSEALQATLATPWKLPGRLEA